MGWSIFGKKQKEAPIVSPKVFFQVLNARVQHVLHETESVKPHSFAESDPHVRARCYVCHKLANHHNFLAPDQVVAEQNILNELADKLRLPEVR